jgi:zinc protease
MEDWTQALSLDPEEIDLERGVVIEEWRGGLGAQSRIRDKQIPVLLGGSRYANRLPIGTLESLEGFEHESLRRFYRDWYRPELMAVVAVGDFETATIEALIRTHFEPVLASVNPRERAANDVPDSDETLFSIVTDEEVPITNISVYYKIPADDDRTVGGYRQQLVEQLYNGMLNERFSEMTRRADAPFLGAQSAQGRLVRPLNVYLLGAPVVEGGIERGLEALLVEAERVARFGFVEAELARQKAAMLRGMESAHAGRESRNSGSYAAEYIRAYLTEEPIPGIEYEYALYHRFLPEITLAEVNRVGQRWIADSTRRMVTVAAPEKAGVAVPDEAALGRVIVRVADAEITPYEEATVDQPLLSAAPQGSPVVETRSLEGGLTEWVLGNGVKVVIKPTDFQKDQVVFRAFSPGGTSLMPDELFQPASSAAALIANGGVGDFDATGLRRKLTGKVANVSPVIGDYDEGLQGSASPTDLETMFQLIYLRFTAPRADEAFFEVFKTQNRSLLANRAANPAAAFGDAVTRLVYGDHLRQRPPTLEMLDELDLDASLAFYQDRFADASDFTFIFVGALELDTLRPLVETYLGGLPVTRRTETWRDVGIRSVRGVHREAVRRGIEPQSQTRIVMTGSFECCVLTEQTRLSAMAQLLQTRLRNLLREELGGTYGVNIGANTAWQPVGTYTVTIQFGSDPGRAEELAQRVFQSIDELKKSGPTEQEVADVRQALLRSDETNLEENGFWLNRLYSIYRHGVETGAGRIFQYADSVRALGTADIQATAVRYLDTNNYVHVTLLPER